MIGFLKRNLPSGSRDLPPNMAFKSNEAAFEFACKLHSDAVREGSGHVGIVLDSKALLGTQDAVKTQDNGRQLAVLKIANADGGFIVPAMTAIPNAPPLKPGDLVLWVAGKHLPEQAKHLGDSRKGWVGLIYAVLAPELNTET